MRLGWMDEMDYVGGMDWTVLYIIYCQFSVKDFFVPIHLKRFFYPPKVDAWHIH